MSVLPVVGNETVSDPLEHSSLVVTVHVDVDSLWLAPWDAGGTLGGSYRPGVTVWRAVLCSVVRLSRRPVLSATGYLWSFRDLGRTCVMDLDAGKSRALAEILGDDPQVDFPRSQFLSGGMGVLP